MARKQSYKIPSSLDVGYTDMEIALTGKDGLGTKPLPLKIIFTYMASGFSLFFLMSNTFVSAGSIVQSIGFAVLWILLTVLLASFDKTKRMQIELVPTLIKYLSPGTRKVLTRTTNLANDFYHIVGIESIDDNTGLVTYTDGSFGYWYRVVGSASVLLFDADKDRIIERVDSFYRKIDNEAEFIFITTKESQHIYKQLANLRRQYDRLEIKNDPDFHNLIREQHMVLKDFVGGSFKSIHQYLVVKGDNREALTRARNVLQSEVENSSRMIKQCVALYTQDINSVLSLIYKGGD